MTYREFIAFISNLPYDSQLGSLVEIRRAEGEEYENLTPEQKQLKEDWLMYIYNKNHDEDDIRKNEEMLQQSLKAAFYRGSD